METKGAAAPLAYEDCFEMDDENDDSAKYHLLTDPLNVHFGDEQSKASGKCDEKLTNIVPNSQTKISVTTPKCETKPSNYKCRHPETDDGVYSKGDNSQVLNGLKGSNSNLQADEHSDSYESRLEHCLDADDMCVDFIQNEDIESRRYSKTAESPRNDDSLERNANPFQSVGDDDDDSNTELFATEDLYTPGRYRRQFLIGIFLKYSIFIFNFLFWVAAVCGFGYGYWLLTSKGQIFSSGVYSVLEPPVLLCTVSFIIFIVAFFGFLGALRENILLLKIFRLSLVLVLLIQTLIGIMVFVFYTMPEARESLLAGPESVLKDAIKRYHDDKGSREWIDLIQKEFKCCGISHTREGYKDWQINMYFNCSKRNPSIERCAVPVSCCIFEPGDYVNVMCGYGTTDMPRERVFKRIYTKGCMRGLADWMRGNESYIGAFLLGFVTPQILGVVFSTLYMHHIKRSRTRWRLLKRSQS